MLRGDDAHGIKEECALVVKTRTTTAFVELFAQSIIIKPAKNVRIMKAGRASEERHLKKKRLADAAWLRGVGDAFNLTSNLVFIENHAAFQAGRERFVSARRRKAGGRSAKFRPPAPKPQSGCSSPVRPSLTRRAISRRSSTIRSGAWS